MTLRIISGDTATAGSATILAPMRAYSSSIRYDTNVAPAGSPSAIRRRSKASYPVSSVDGVTSKAYSLGLSEVP